MIAISAVYFCNRAIENAADGKLYSDANTIPYNKVALVPGTSKFFSDNRMNPFFITAYRQPLIFLMQEKLNTLL